MRWPWGDRPRPADEPAVQQDRPATVSPAGWASLPPLRGQVTAIHPTADLTSFPGRGSAWGTPALTSPVQRQVAVGMPVLARAVTSPRESSHVVAVPDLPVVARAVADQPPHAAKAARAPSAGAAGTAAPVTLGGPSLTRSPDTHLPVLALPTEPVPDAPIEAADALPELVPVQAVSTAPPPPSPAAPDVPVRSAPREPEGGDEPSARAALPLVVQRSEATAAGPGATEVTIPDTTQQAPWTPPVPPPTGPVATAADPAPSPGHGRVDPPPPVQRLSTLPGANRPGGRIGLGAPLASSPATPAAPAPLPVVQRSAPGALGSTPITSNAPPAGPPALATPRSGTAPAADPPQVPTAVPSATPESTPESTAESAPGTDLPIAAPAEAPDTTEAPLGPEAVAPEAPEAAPSTPLTLSRSGSEAALPAVDNDATPGTPATSSPPPADHDRAHAPSPDSGPVLASRESPITTPAPVPGAPGSLPLVTRDAARLADVVVSRWADTGGTPPSPAHNAVWATPGQAPDRVTPSNADSAARHRPAYVRPTLQRAARPAVTPEPPPTLQRLPGLSSLPGMVRDRPALPTGTPQLPASPIRMPDGLPGSAASMPSLPSMPSFPSMPSLPSTSMPPLPSGPSSVPDLPGLGATRPETVADPAGLPMPVATARALVAAVSAASPTGLGAPAPRDGIPDSPPVPAATEEAPPPAPSAPAAPADAGVGPATGPAPVGVAAPAGPASSPQELDELARRLYDPLASRLRAELLLDRERRGLRTDAW